MTRVEAQSISFGNKLEVYGYEIHMGISTIKGDSTPLFNIKLRNGEKLCSSDGAINSSGNIMGTYIHGVFDGEGFREYILNRLRTSKGISCKKAMHYESLREKNLDSLAAIVRSSLDMNKIYEIAGLRRG